MPEPDPWCRRQAEALGVAVLAVEPAGAGMTSRVERWRLADGDALIAKRPRLPPGPGLYASEAEGLAALAGIPGVRVPSPRLVRPDGIVLEDLGPQHGPDPGPADPFWEVLGRGVAHLHGRLHGRFGWHRPTYWGVLRLDQSWEADGAAFHRRRFHWFLARPGVRAALGPGLHRRVEAVADRLDRLIPAQPPCLNHGDLWHGNRLRDRNGGPALADPFIHIGWAESDLSHAWIYGGFPPRFWDAYRESHPLEPGWPRRLELLGLIHHLAVVNEIGPDPETMAAIAATA